MTSILDRAHELAPSVFLYNVRDLAQMGGVRHYETLDAVYTSAKTRRVCDFIAKGLKDVLAACKGHMRPEYSKGSLRIFARPSAGQGFLVISRCMFFSKFIAVAATGFSVEHSE